jgi:hypothetical protein
MMDPNIMQAMAAQTFGEGVQVSMEPTPEAANPVGAGVTYDDVYDEDMPF